MATEQHLTDESGIAASSPPLPQAHSGGALRQRAWRILHILGQFVYGQGAAQGISLLANLFLVHRMSVEAYAQFGIALGFQNVFSILMDLGFASTIVPLVADRRDDKAVVGRYVRAANHLRNRSFSVLAPIAAISFLAVMHKHHWSLSLQLLLLASVILSLYSGGTMAYFSAPLFIFRRLKDYYFPQALFGLLRLLAFVALGTVGWLTAWSAAGLSALYLTGTAAMIKNKSRRFFLWPATDSPETNHELLHYILPASPAIIFSAFQTQISLLLVSIFGGTLFIAEVAALSRIGQLFMLMLTMCSIVVEPYMARLPREKVLRNFFFLLGLSTAVCLPLLLIAFRWPGAYIWVIGAKYAGVKGLLGWYVLSLSMNFVSGVAWVMNRARKWVFWSGSILEVVLVVAVQVGFLWLRGVSTTREAVFFNLAGSFCYVIAHGYVSVFGFIKGPRLKTAEVLA